MRQTSTVRAGNFGTNWAEPAALFKTALIFLAGFALYFFLRSPGLDEVDSVQFAMGVREFNIWMHQPHPPGYPLYIFLGWIGTKCFDWGPDFSLHVVSAFGGALFVAAWFFIIRLEFSESLGWWIAVCLAITPTVWMTSTKVLTDSLAAGFLSVELIAALIYFYRGGIHALIATGLFGAAATGARPQMIATALIVLITALAGHGAKLKTWLLGFTALFGSCMLWLVPMWWSQARLRSDIPVWHVYPKLLYGQWKWRLDKPYAYIGAGDWSLKYLGHRFYEHIFGWFGLGFGFVQSRWILVAGVLIVIVALVAYAFSKRETADRGFWRFHSAWALIHIAIIFVCLPPSQRYYIVIFPLLLVAIIRGFLRLPRRWSLSALALPVLFLYIDIPIATANHRDDPPPLQLVRYLEKLYPASRRKDVVLLFASARRHAEWYTPGFVTFQNTPSSANLPKIVEHAAAIYVDDRKIPLPKGWHLIPLVEFHRSTVIHSKHRHLTLYLVAREEKS